MLISETPGIEMLERFRSELNYSHPPIFIFILFPNLSTDEYQDFMSKSREIDRLTDEFLHVIVFWKVHGYEKLDDDGKCDTVNNIEFDDPNFYNKKFNSYIESRARKFNIKSSNSILDYKDIPPSPEITRNRLISGESTSEDFVCLKNGAVDESYTMARALNISLSNLPCLVIFDSLETEQFYTLPYEGKSEFFKLTTSIVDFLQNEYRSFFEVRQELSDVAQKAKTMSSIKNRKKIQKINYELAKTGESRQILENIKNSLENNGKNEVESLKLITYLMDHPLDITAKEKLSRLIEEKGLLEKFKDFEIHTTRHLKKKAEISLFGNSKKEIINKKNLLTLQFQSMNSPSIKPLMDKEKRNYKARTLSEASVNLGQRLKSISEFVRYFLSLVARISSG